MPNSIANKIKLPDSTIIEINDNRIIVSNPQSGQVLSYDSINDYWTNQTIDIHDGIILLTYNDLCYALNHNELIPGQKYRITDYVTTTAQTNTQSANHPFDLIVLATSSNTLDCQAKAVLHSGDTYFSASGNTCDLSKWQVWYDINNDTNKYAWADSTNGKGVIYRMIDDLDNDCPYDFKNIQFKRKLTNGAYDPISGTDTWVYTFSIYQNNTIEDSSLVKTNEVHDNKQGSHKSSSKLTLNNNVFMGNYCYSNTIGDSCYSNTFGNGCYSNTFGDDCSYNLFGDYCSFTTFGNGCYNHIFGDNCSGNVFGSNCSGNILGESCHNNNIGDDSYSNTFSNFCDCNTLGVLCYNITFGNASNQGGTYCSFNIVENGNRNIRLYTSPSVPADYNHQLQNIYIAQGVNNTNTDTWLDISTIARNLSYRTTVGRESDGTLRIYNEDDKYVSGTNDGTNWTSLTIGDTTKAIPSGGGSSTLAGLSDTLILSPSFSGELLMFNRTLNKWVNSDDYTPIALSMLSFDMQYLYINSFSSRVDVAIGQESKRGGFIIDAMPSAANQILNIELSIKNYYENYLWIYNKSSYDLQITFANFIDPTGAGTGDISWVISMPDSLTVESKKLLEIGICLNNINGLDDSHNFNNADVFISITDRQLVLTRS